MRSSVARRLHDIADERLRMEAAMSDETYVTLLLWTICTLTFACGVVALTEHPEWFGS